MTFDIHRALTIEPGEIDERAADELECELVKLFAESPEAQPIIERDGSVGWAKSMLEYGRIYEGATVATMSGRDVSRILLGTFPRKVSCEPSVAPQVVEELRAFWSFLRRELSLKNADECIAVLDDEMARKMERELADPRNYGMAKSFVMAGMAAGFDMTSEEGMAAFTSLYNATNPLAAARTLASPTPVPSSVPRPLTKAEKNKKKAQRRAQRTDRRKNR